MIISMYAILDMKVKAYNTPLFMRNKGEAIRSFTEVCNDPKTMFHKYPEDYVMFELGTYNDEDCTFDLHKVPLPVGRASEFRRFEKPVEQQFDLMKDAKPS